MSLCSHCITGFRHDGTPEGKMEFINGVRTYVATPTVDYAKDKAILYLPEVLGLDLVNNQLLADNFARNGWQVYAVDYFDGDGIPLSEFNPANLKPWLARHGPEVTRPLLDKVISGLKERGIKEFAATGYCFGGRYVFDLGFDKVIKVGAVSHPSLLKVPEDFEKFKESGIPLLINSCELDHQLTIASQAVADEILGGGSTTSELYRREYWAGCIHGFAVRGDLSKPHIKAAKEGAFNAIVKFFKERL